MTWHDLQNKPVQFKSTINDWEGGFEAGMRARVADLFSLKPGLVGINFDFSKYEEINKEFMTPNYFDGDRVARLKWCEWDRYPKNKIETLYFDINSNPEEFVTVLENEDSLIDQINLLIPVAERMNLDKAVLALRETLFWVSV